MKEPGAELEDRWTRVRRYTLYYQASTGLAVHDTPVVLVHGLVVSSRYMQPLARVLAPYYRVYMLDLPGFGRSEKPTNALNIIELADVLADWMKTLGLQLAILLGNSFGCQIIAHLVMRHRECVRYTILAGPTMDPRARTALRKVTRWLINILFEPSSLYPIVIRDFVDCGFRRFVQTFRYALRDRIEEHLPEMRVPTLVVRGSRDTIVPQRWAEEAAELLPEGELVVIDNAAHDVNYNSPEELLKIFRSFVEVRAPMLERDVER